MAPNTRPMDLENGGLPQTVEVENTVVDEANGLTYVVMANRILNDGELYSAIRIELLKRTIKPGKGQRLVIPAPNSQAAASRPTDVKIGPPPEICPLPALV
jgi:hypothetical protein